jgi:TMEM175 potassium channel family protein
MVENAGQPPPVPMPRGREALRLLSTAGNLEYDRVLFFSDAVFAIAITLLVVDLHVPNLPASLIHAGQQLRDVEPRIFGFVLSFAVIGLFWIGHHSIFRLITALDRTLILINLLFLGTIAFLPYPTALLGATGTSQPPATIFYAACVAAAGLGEAAIWLWAIRAGLVADTVPPPLRRYFAARMLRTPVVFGLSIPVAIVAPGVAPYLWLALIPIGVALRHFMLKGETLREEADEPEA